MGSIRTRKGAKGVTYAALWRDETGKQRSKTFTSQKAAKAFLRPRSAVAGYRAPVPQNQGTVAAYAATWIEQHQLKPMAKQTYRNHLSKHILPALGRLQLAHVTSADIYVAVKKWQQAGMSLAQQAKCRTILSAMFRDAALRGVIASNPVRDVPVPRQTTPEMHVLSVEEYRRVLPHLDPQARLMVRLAVASGARWGELSELRGADLDGNTLTIARTVSELENPRRWEIQPTPKNGRSRRVKIPAALAAEIHGHATGPDELLFPAAKGGHLACDRFRLRWYNAQEAAGIHPPVRIHDLRHMAITYWLADGMPLVTARDRAGHSSLAITSRYAHAIDDAEDAALNRSAA